MLKQLALLCFISLSSSGLLRAQIPFDAFSVEEVPIPADAQAEIDLQAPGARCYRVYICMNEPLWELLAVYGYVFSTNVFPGFVNLVDPVGTRFYQHPSAGLGSTGVNPALFPFLPGYAYDSFVTIKRTDNQNNDMLLGPGSWGDDFNLNGGNINLSDSVGGSWYMAINRTPSYSLVPPFDPIPGTWSTSIQNMPESDNRILIAQLTTNGIFNGQVNLLFRRLLPGRISYNPVQSVDVVGVTFTNSPGVMDLPCALIFLPVGMINFEANAATDRVNLSWTTETETNNDYFTIQRSKDGINFEDIRTVDGAGNSSSRIIYSSLDENPYDGVSYYRLRQTDFDGSSEYTEMVAVEFYNQADITIYPNPNKTGQLQVKGSNSGIVSVKILSGDGKLLSFEQINEEVLQFIDLSRSNLPAGLHFVEFIYDSGQTVKKKLIVER